MQRARSKENKEIKKQEIKDKAIILFLENTKELPSVSQIANACNMSKGALYTYFKTKEEIFLDVLTDEYFSWFKSCKEIISSENDFKILLDKTFNPIFKNILLLELASKMTQVIEVNSSLERTVEFKLFLGEAIDELSTQLNKKFNISKDIILKNLIESFTVIVGAYQTSLIPHEDLRKRVSYAFLFPDFERHAKGLLRKVWQF